MASPVVARVGTSYLINNFLHLAQNSVYQLSINPTGAVIDHVKRTKGITWKEEGAKINFLCESTQMPGSSLATHDNKSDFMGVSEKFAYRRMYPEQFSCSFYVDHDYKLLHFFEGWMDFISGNSAANRGTSDNYKSVQNGFRMNFPDSYRSQIELTKFEKDTDKDNIKMYHYTMVDAFPLSMDPIEISYGQSELLRLNVNFSIVRYVVHPISETSKTVAESTPKVDKSGLVGPQKTSVKLERKSDPPTPTDTNFSPLKAANENTSLMSGFVPSSIGQGIA